MKSYELNFVGRCCETLAEQPIDLDGDCVDPALKVEGGEGNGCYQTATENAQRASAGMKYPRGESP